MQTSVSTEMSARSEILADALGETIAELRLIDAGDMIAYIRSGQWANISDLVQSSAELSFRDGALSFAYSGEAEMSWGSSPRVALDLEFQTRDLTAFFTLTMGDDGSEVRIRDVMFASAQADERSATQLFARALAAARRGADGARG